jgi:hypothetical protein
LKEIVDVALDGVAQDETPSTNLHALELSMSVAMRKYPLVAS